MKSIKHLCVAFAAAASVLVLAGCGGGGESAGVATDTPPVGSEVPSSAISTSAGAVAFVKTVASFSDNTAAPLVLGDATLATSDTDEPDPGI